MSAAAPSTQPREQHVLVPIGKLHESPFNRRRTWGHLEELAASFASVGILEDLLGRPHPSRPGEIELAAGHRRLRAAKLAKLSHVPVKVRELTDEQVLEIQLIENIQREDIHPIEEAETFELQRDKAHLSVDDLAARVGKSKAYVYARMKLLDLIPEARAAFVDGRLTPSVALLVARVPTAMQVDALEQLARAAKGWQHENGTPVSFRESADILEGRYTLDLAGAPFDRKDLTLVPGAPACAGCPKRAGNQKGLFDDDPLPEDACTDPTCFAAKRDAHAAHVAEKLRAKGIEVLPGKRSRFGDVKPPKGYVAATGHIHGKPVEHLLDKARARKPRTPSLKAVQSKTMMIGDSGKPIEIVREEDLRTALNLKAPAAPAARDWKAEQKRRDEEEAVRNKATVRIMGIVVEKVEAMKGAPTPALLRLLAREALRAAPDNGMIGDRRGWTRPRDWSRPYEAEVAKLPVAELLGVIVEAVCLNDDVELKKGYAGLAKLFGLDLEAIEKTAREDATKQVAPEADAEPAARPAKKASTKGRKK